MEMPNGKHLLPEIWLAEKSKFACSVWIAMSAVLSGDVILPFQVIPTSLVLALLHFSFLYIATSTALVIEEHE